MRRRRRILVATDGSPRARRAARFAASLARRTGARMVGIYVVVERVPTLFDAGLYAFPVEAPALRREIRRRAELALSQIQREAGRRRVPCDCVRAHGSHIWKAILGTARRRHCDLVVVGSRRALASETKQLLAHSSIPVLICR